MGGRLCMYGVGQFVRQELGARDLCLRLRDDSVFGWVIKAGG